MHAPLRTGALAALTAVLLAACGGGGGSTAGSGSAGNGGGGTSATVQGVSTPSSVSVVTATNAGS